MFNYNYKTIPVFFRYDSKYLISQKQLFKENRIGNKTTRCIRQSNFICKNYKPQSSSKRPLNVEMYAVEFSAVLLKCLAAMKLNREAKKLLTNKALLE